MRRILPVAFGLPIGLGLILGAEVWYAIAADRLPEREPLDLDTRIDGPGETLRIAWVGDSVAAGVGASEPDAALPRLVARGVGRAVDLHVFAVSGDRAADALSDQLPRLEALRPAPDVVVVEIGANDVTRLTSAFGFRRTYDAILARASRLGARHVLALGTPGFGATPRFLQPLRAIAGWRSRRLDAEVRASAAAFGATYVDIAGPTGPGFAADPEGTHAADRFHPSDAGYELWSDAVLDALLPLLARN